MTGSLELDTPSSEDMLAGFFRNPAAPDDASQVYFAAQELPTDAETLGVWIAVLIDSVLDVVDDAASPEARAAFATQALNATAEILGGGDDDDSDEYEDA